MVFESLATNEYGIYLGPTDLSPDNIGTLATPALKKCFPEVLADQIGNYS